MINPSQITPEPPFFSSEDKAHMLRALALASIPKGQTRPNPMVGCVIVKEGRVIGEGFHRRAGEPHAEREALANCTENPTGSTVYVTLEPCTHHGRTPPCSEALIAAGISRLVVAQPDPNPQAKGGVAQLAAAGIACQMGLFQTEAELLNAPFNLFHRHNAPLVTLKWATTLDGCTSTATGSSKWITGEQARQRVHEQRAAHDCVVVGIGTALADAARLTVRDGELLAPAPKRVVFDSYLRLNTDHPLITADPATAVIVGLQTASPEARFRLEQQGATVVLLPAKSSGQISPAAFLEWCAQNALQSVYVEGGRTLAGSFWSEGLVHRLHSFIAPTCIGFTERGLSPLKMLDPLQRMEQKEMLEQVQVEQLGPDVLISGWTKRALTLIAGPTNRND